MLPIDFLLEAVCVIQHIEGIIKKPSSQPGIDLAPQHKHNNIPSQCMEDNSVVYGRSMAAS